MKHPPREWVRNKKTDQFRHWLGEGGVGQESLFLDLDPYLYVLDQAICKCIALGAHEYDNHEGRPLAVLVPPEESVSWHIGYVGNLYDLLVCAEPDNEIRNEAACQFGAVVGDLRADIEPLQLYLHLDKCWIELGEFVDAVRETRQYLGESGMMAFMLNCWGVEGSLEVCWAEGMKSPLSELVDGDKLFDFDSPKSVISKCLTEITASNSFGLGDFLKRHKMFFGKNARDFALDRFQDLDFRDSFSDEDASKRWATLLVFDSGNAV